MVQKFKTKNKEVFTYGEIKQLIESIDIKSYFNEDKFYDVLRGVTCQLINNEVIVYPCDVEKAIICGIENRNLKKL